MAMDFDLAIPFKIGRDGNQWCCLLGEDLQEGVAGFGDTITEAWINMAEHMVKAVDANDQEFAQWLEEQHERKYPYFTNDDGHRVYYVTVREAMAGEPYSMAVAGQDRDAVIAAVNEGIDAHLEACNSPERGDRYEHAGGKLVCSISPESLPVLLRRLFNSVRSDNADDVADAGATLARDMLQTLGIDNHGALVGREALGLD